MPYSPDAIANFAITTLAGGAGGVGTALNPGDTTLFLNSGAGNTLFANTPAPFRLLLGTWNGPHEIMSVTARTNDTCTVVRANNLAQPDTGAGALTWQPGTVIECVWTGGTQMRLNSMVSSLAYNARSQDYGAKGDGVTDDRPAIQAALNAAHTAGGGCVYLPAGTYLVSTTTNPTDNTYSAALFVYANTVLLGDGPGATIIKLASTAANQAAIVQNAHVSGVGGNDANIMVCDLTINGNAVNQPGTSDRNNGIYFAQMRGIRVAQVDVKNVLGTTGGANGVNGTPGEGHHIVVNYSTDVLFDGCTAYSDDTGQTGSAIGSSSCVNVRMTGCASYSMQHGWGFTTYDTSALNIDSCVAYLCNSGYFAEIGQDVVFSNCVAGTLASQRNTAYPWTLSQSLAITSGAGPCFSSSGTVNFRMVNCVGYGGIYGCHLANQSVPAINQQQTSIVGCRFSHSSSVGLWMQNVNDVEVVGCHAESCGASGFYVDTIAAGWVTFTDCTSVGNTGYGYECHGSTSPFVLIRDCQASGNTVNDVLANGTGYKVHGTVAAPGVPLTTVALTSFFPMPVNVYVNANGATFTATGTQINGTTTGATTGVFSLKPSDTITLNYSAGTPSWTWWAV